MQSLTGQHQTGHQGHSRIRPNSRSQAFDCLQRAGFVICARYVSFKKTTTTPFHDKFIALKNTSHIFTAHCSFQWDLTYFCTYLFPMVCLTLFRIVLFVCYYIIATYYQYYLSHSNRIYLFIAIIFAATPKCKASLTYCEFYFAFVVQ